MLPSLNERKNNENRKTAHLANFGQKIINLVSSGRKSRAAGYGVKKIVCQNEITPIYCCQFVLNIGRNDAIFSGIA